MERKKPLIAVPIGDPAGVGPEIVAKACALANVNEAADVIVIGDRQVMENASYARRHVQELISMLPESGS